MPIPVWAILAPSLIQAGSSLIGSILGSHNAKKATERVISSAPNYAETVGATQTPWGGIKMTPLQQQWYGLQGAVAGDILNYIFSPDNALANVGRELFGNEYKAPSLFNWSAQGDNSMLAPLTQIFNPQNIYGNMPAWTTQVPVNPNFPQFTQEDINQMKGGYWKGNDRFGFLQPNISPDNMGIMKLPPLT